MEAKRSTIRGLKLNVVPGFKLLGHRCTTVKGTGYSQDAEEAANEAVLRVGRIASLPLNQKQQPKLVKTSPITVARACTQWCRPNFSTLNSLKQTITNIVWGRTRKMRCYEVVMGILNEGADYEPALAIIWQTLANARRLMFKTPGLEQSTAQSIDLRVQLEMKYAEGIVAKQKAENETADEGCETATVQIDWRVVVETDAVNQDMI